MSYMVCHCSMAGTEACKRCPRYIEYFGEPSEKTNVYMSRPKGKWLDRRYGYSQCSNCGEISGQQCDGVEIIPYKSKYCPSCGAQMESEHDKDI